MPFRSYAPAHAREIYKTRDRHFVPRCDFIFKSTHGLRSRFVPASVIRRSCCCRLCKSPVNNHKPVTSSRPRSKPRVENPPLPYPYQHNCAKLFAKTLTSRRPLLSKLFSSRSSAKNNETDCHGFTWNTYLRKTDFRAAGSFKRRRQVDSAMSILFD